MTPTDASSLPTELRLALDWELWVVEQLLFTGKREDLVQTLVAQGIEGSTARARVTEILESDGFGRLRHRMGEATLAARLQRLQGELSDMQREGPTVVATRESVDRRTLLAEHWIPSRPLRLTNAAAGMRAVERWSLQHLADRFGDVQVQVNVERTRATCSVDTEKRGRMMPLAEFMARAQAEPSNDLYIVSRNGLLANPELAPLWDDLTPVPEILEPPRRPRGVSLWIGPAGTVTPPHFDPHNVLLVQVEGRKRIRLAPRLRSARHDELDGYYLRRSLDETFEASTVATVTLEAGQALFVPVGWFHEVTALAPSVTLSLLCFPWPNHFHFLGPPGSDDVDR